MENLYGKYKCIKSPSDAFSKVNGVESGDFLSLNEKDVTFEYDSITNDPILFYYKESIPFKLVDDNIYTRSDHYTGEYLISTNPEYGEEIKYYYFFDYFISIKEHRMNIAKMINDL